jgi:hypothetical protein
MDDQTLRQILQTARTIASVGLSSNPEKESYGVGQYLQSRGYRVVPVNPTVKEILGVKAYPDLRSVPYPIDVVQVFRPSGDVPEVVDQAIQVGARVVWMQLGIRNEQAAEIARAAGLQVVMDRCMRVEHIRLFGMTPA